MDSGEESDIEAATTSLSIMLGPEGFVNTILALQRTLKEQLHGPAQEKKIADLSKSKVSANNGKLVNF